MNAATGVVDLSSVYGPNAATAIKFRRYEESKNNSGAVSIQMGNYFCFATFSRALFSLKTVLLVIFISFPTIAVTIVMYII